MTITRVFEADLRDMLEMDQMQSGYLTGRKDAPTRFRQTPVSKKLTVCLEIIWRNSNAHVDLVIRHFEPSNHIVLVKLQLISTFNLCRLHGRGYRSGYIQTVLLGSSAPCVFGSRTILCSCRTCPRRSRMRTIVLSTVRGAARLRDYGVRCRS